MDTNSKNNLSEFISINEKEKESNEEILNTDSTVNMATDSSLLAADIPSNAHVGSVTVSTKEATYAQNSGKILNITFKNGAITKPFIESDLGYKEESVLSIYKDFPIGNFVVNTQGVFVRQEEQEVINQAIETLRAKIQQYGENSQTIKGKTWIQHFKEVLQSHQTWQASKEQYLLTLYRIDELLGTAGNMTIALLNKIKDTFDSLIFGEFSYDSFYKVAKFILGFGAYKLSGANEGSLMSWLGYTEEFYNNKRDKSSFTTMVSQLIREFFSFVDKVTAAKKQLYLVHANSRWSYLSDPTYPGSFAQIPCGFYVQQGIDGNKDTLSVHISFRIFGKNFDLAVHQSSVELDTDLIATVPTFQLMVSE